MFFYKLRKRSLAVFNYYGRLEGATPRAGFDCCTAAPLVHVDFYLWQARCLCGGWYLPQIQILNFKLTIPVVDSIVASLLLWVFLCTVAFS